MERLDPHSKVIEARRRFLLRSLGPLTPNSKCGCCGERLGGPRVGRSGRMRVWIGQTDGGAPIATHWGECRAALRRADFLDHAGSVIWTPPASPSGARV